jgi:hypothetical protein
MLVASHKFLGFAIPSFQMKIKAWKIFKVEAGEKRLSTYQKGR